MIVSDPTKWDVPNIAATFETPELAQEMEKRWNAYQEWQLIETAPKDGTIVLVWAKHSGRIIDFYNIDHQGWHSFLPRLQPTHWVSLPESPKDSQ